jgi:argininosuccinate synthase
MTMPDKVVLAYSGGLDTSAIVPWLIENHDCEVIAVVGDVGQGAAELAGVEEKAIRSGASQCHVVDLKRAFLEECAWPALMAGAVYEGRYLLGTAIARPVLARAQVQVALDTGATALAHGCTGKGNDQVRFECAYAALAPHLKVIAPWREWDLKSREDLLEYLRVRNIECSASVEKIYSRDANLWHVSHEGGELEDPWNAPPEDIWMRTTAPELAPNEAGVVEIGFDAGRARTLNGEPLRADELVEKLNRIAGRHGVGRVDIVENRLVGMKSRGCYETPAGTVLFEALRALEEIVLDRETLALRSDIAARFSRVVYDGQWFTPVRRALAAAIECIAAPLTGEVRVRLFKGSATAVSRRSENALYDEQYATFGASAVYDHKDAAGFIRLFSLPSRITAGRERGVLAEKVGAAR